LTGTTLSVFPTGRRFAGCFVVPSRDELVTVLGALAIAAIKHWCGPLRRLMVDGETQYGSRAGGVPGRQLLVVAHDDVTDVVMAYVAEGVMPNEVPVRPALLACPDLVEVIGTADGTDAHRPVVRW
jgi:hypothetical protein